MSHRYTTFAAVCTAMALLVGGAALAAEEVAPSIGTKEYSDFGTYLVDEVGMSLYGFLPDDAGTSTCYDDCAETWPPLLATDDLTLGEGLDEALLGTVEREGGEQQVTYGGWPLYRFVQDERPGEVAGHGVGGNWFLVAPDGSLLRAGTAASEGAEDATPGDAVDDGGGAEGNGAPDADHEAFMAEGETVFHRTAEPTCASCHGEQGEGGVGPSLVDSRVVQNTGRLIRTILHGGQMMPRFGDQLSDREVAAVATFVRNAWGNDDGVVTEEEVVEQR